MSMKPSLRWKGHLQAWTDADWTSFSRNEVARIICRVTVTLSELQQVRQFMSMSVSVAERESREDVEA